MNVAENQIRLVWDAEQEILDVIHEICRVHNLKYTLSFGTLLGAVRHGGFIPWDDDIDILMPRTDYEKLISIWNREAPQGYLLQNKRTDMDFTQNFTKIRKDNTTFIQDEFEKKKNYHTGIFVDIFPADRLAPGKIGIKLQYIASAVNLLCSRGYSSGRKGIIGFVEKIILAFPLKLRMKLYTASERFISRWEDKVDTKWFSPNTIDVCKRYFDHDIFDEITTIGFNGKTYCCVKDYDSFLTKTYGDYMKLPPLEDRVWKHHPLVVDFTRNYSELQGR